MTKPHVPRQLNQEKFIVLSPHDKRPAHKWSNPAYQYNAKDISSWLDCGFNYAVLYKTNIAVLDADNGEKLKDVIAALQPTFTVKSGRTSGVGYHVYLRIPDEIPPEYQTQKLYLNDPETGESLGDVRLPGCKAYNVAPYSYHPSGKQYLPVDESVEIREIGFASLFETIKPFIPPEKVSQKSAKPRIGSPVAVSSMDAYGYTCFDFLNPLNPHMRANGEVEGVHPIHGSTTGSNLTIAKDGSRWYCRRCGTGGGWVKALAVSEGIIECSEADRAFTRKEWKEVDSILARLKPAVHDRLWVERMKNWKPKKAGDPAGGTSC